jgi:hypothetical protein
MFVIEEPVRAYCSVLSHAPLPFRGRTRADGGSPAGRLPPRHGRLLQSVAESCRHADVTPWAGGRGPLRRFPLVTMSARELERLALMQRIPERRTTQQMVAEQLVPMTNEWPGSAADNLRDETASASARALASRRQRLSSFEASVTRNSSSNGCQIQSKRALIRARIVSECRGNSHCMRSAA